MKYSVEDQMREIMLRKRRRQRCRSRQITELLSGAAVCLTVACAAVISGFSGAETAYASDNVYGAFLLSSRSGGYVLCMVAAFVCGSLLTAFCIRRKQKPNAEKAEKTAAPKQKMPDPDESTRK